MLAKLQSKWRGVRGFSLIEMAIVLLIAGLLIAGAFQLTSNMQQQRTDQATANEMRNIVTALERFLVDEQANLVYSGSPVVDQDTPQLLQAIQMNPATVPAPAIDARTYFENNYLGINTATLRLDPRGYTIGIRNLGSINGRPVLKGLVLRNPPSRMNEARLSRAAALVGSQGGLVRDNGSGAAEIAGVSGAWTVTAADYAVTPTIGQMAAFTTTSDTQMNTNLLSRINTGNAEANTMRTDLLMGQDSQGVPTLLRNAMGLVLTRTQSRVGEGCDSGDVIRQVIILDSNGATISTQDINLTTTAGQNNLSPIKVQNAVVYGLSSDGTTPQLIQCQSISGSWLWRSAFSASQASVLWNYQENKDVVAGSMGMTAIPDGIPSLANTGYLVTNGENIPGYSVPTRGTFQGSLTLGVNSTLVRSISTTNFRARNTWWHNDLSYPIYVTIYIGTSSDRINPAVFIRQNYNPVTGQAATARPIVRGRSATSNVSISFAVPPNALYGIMITENEGEDTLLESWSELR
jgi:prepilin-type N-terminal cleavage/methylation domain-containing protein